MQIRDWLYVEDHCAAIAAVLKRARPARCTTSAATTREPISRSSSLAFSPTPARAKTLSYTSRIAPGHDRYAIDNHKITTELGWSPKYTFQTGMASTIEWYLHNREWMDKIVSGEYMKYYERMYANNKA